MANIGEILSIAKRANKIVMNYFGKIDYSLKRGEYYSKQLLTEADTKVEEFLFRSLAKKYPKYNFFGEEKGVIDKESEYTFLVDPISSTNNYIHKMPHFAVVVSLLKNDSPILAVVLDSFYNELFHAVKGRGAYLNNNLIKVSSISDLKKSIITSCWSKKDGKSIAQGLYYSNKLSGIATTRRIGSLALQLAWIADGRMDAFLQNENDFFSLVAGSLIVKEAGGVVTDFGGEGYSKNSGSIVASNGRIHKEIMRCIKNPISSGNDL